MKYTAAAKGLVSVFLKCSTAYAFFGLVDGWYSHSLHQINSGNGLFLYTRFGGSLRCKLDGAMLVSGLSKQAW